MALLFRPTGFRVMISASDFNFPYIYPSSEFIIIVQRFMLSDVWAMALLVYDESRSGFVICCIIDGFDIALLHMFTEPVLRYAMISMA